MPNRWTFHLEWQFLVTFSLAIQLMINIYRLPVGWIKRARIF